MVAEAISSRATPISTAMGVSSPKSSRRAEDALQMARLAILRWLTGDALIEDCPAGEQPSPVTTSYCGAGGTLSPELRSKAVGSATASMDLALVGRVTDRSGPDCPGGGFEIQSGQDLNLDDSSTSRRSPKARLSAYRSPKAALAKPGRAFPW